MPARVQIAGGKPPAESKVLVSLAGIRVAWVYLRPTAERHEHSGPVWGVSAYATGNDGDFGGSVGAPILFTLSPSRLFLPPLGAASMIALVAYVPAVPTFSAITFAFFTEKHPDAKADVWGFGDTTAHPYCGLSVCPVLPYFSSPFSP